MKRGQSILLTPGLRAAVITGITAPGRHAVDPASTGFVLWLGDFVIGSTLLGVLAIGWGVVCGGILYEHLAVVPVWARCPPTSLTMLRGEHRLRAERFWISVHPVVVLLLIAALIAEWGDVELRTWVLIALISYAVILVITNTWFVPEVMRLVRAPDGTFEEREWRRRARRWEVLSIARAVLMFALGFPLVQALLASD